MVESARSDTSLHEILRGRALGLGIKLSGSLWWALPLLAAILTTVVALALTPTWGFSLDDAWTHQAFARTLATTGRFAFHPGDGPAGSTSPLWVLLLLPPYLMAHGQPPLVLVVGWTALLGASALGGLGIVAGIAADLIEHTHMARLAVHPPSRRARTVAALIASLGTVSAWQVISFALSGMETVLFALGALLLLVLAGRSWHPAILGLLAAALVYTRPEGVIPAALVLGASGWVAVMPALRGAASQRFRQFAQHLSQWLLSWVLPYGGVLLLALVPYVALNLAASGHPLPTTVYAKAAVSGIGSAWMARVSVILLYCIVLLAPSPLLLALAAQAGINGILRRRRVRPAAPSSRALASGGGGTSQALTVGSNKDAAPAIARASAHTPDVGQRGTNTWLWRAPWPSRSILAHLLWLWPVALILAFSGNFTQIAYRYLVPALPPLIVLGAVGAMSLFFLARGRVVPLVAACALVAIGVLSDIRGIQVYQNTVRDTNQCWVANAEWIRAHVPAGTLLATHDIGAIGYFDDHQLIDMAGLVSPEMIPLLGNERAIEANLRGRRVAYIMMWDNWYPPPAIMAHEFANHILYRGCGGTFDLYQTNW